MKWAAFGLAIVCALSMASAWDARSWVLNKTADKAGLNLTMTQVNTTYENFYYTQPGLAYYSEIEGYATYGVSYDVKTSMTLVDVIKWAPSKELRCTRNNYFSPLFSSEFQSMMYYDYALECV